MSRQIIIGDIHGCYDELLELLALVGATEEDDIVSVGDLVDRGPDSPAVLGFFRERCASGKAVALVGNHERKHIRQIFSYSQEITRLQFGEDYASAVEWMARLPYYYETADCVVVHAALVPGIPLAEQKEEVLAGTVSGERELTSLLGDRPWHELYEGPKPVVFGHLVVGDTPLVERDLIYGLDTGACHGGRLTALVVPEFQLYSVPARADHWEFEKRKWQQPVLLAKPWLDMGYAKATRELDRYADEATDTIVSLRAWLDSLQQLIEAILARLQAEAARIESEAGKEGFTAYVESHPQKALLHLAHRGRLDLPTVQKHCSTPRQTLRMAEQLGISPVMAAPLS